MKTKIYFCIQGQKGYYIFSHYLNSSQNPFKEQQCSYLNQIEQKIWLKKITPKDSFIADQPSFVMKEILKRSPSCFITHSLLLLPYYQENLKIEIVNDDTGRLICDFLYYQSMKNFVKKYDLYRRFGEILCLLPQHIEELQLQELFLINEGRIALFVDTFF